MNMKIVKGFGLTEKESPKFRASAAGRSGDGGLMTVSKLTACLLGLQMPVFIVRAFTLLQSANTLKTEEHLDDSNNSVRTSQRTHRFSITKMNWLTLLRAIIAVCCKNHMKHTNTPCGKMQRF
jgi:hypothetical protein